MARYALLFIAAAATSVAAQAWEPVDKCAPTTTAYECDLEEGGVTTTTVTMVPTGCPGYTKFEWPVHKTKDDAKTWLTWTTTADPAKATWDVVVDDKDHKGWCGKDGKGKDGKPCKPEDDEDHKGWCGKDGKGKDGKPCKPEDDKDHKKCGKDGKGKDGKPCKPEEDDSEDWENVDEEDDKVAKCGKDGKGKDGKPCKPYKCGKDGKGKDGKPCKPEEDDEDSEDWENVDEEDDKVAKCGKDGKDKYGKPCKYHKCGKDGKGKDGKPCKPEEDDSEDWENVDDEDKCGKDGKGKDGKPCKPKGDKKDKKVIVTLTETYKVPCETGWATKTSTIYKQWCGCTETPKPTKPEYDVYTTECPDAWGVGKTVTVTVPKQEPTTWVEADVKTPADNAQTWTAAPVAADKASTWANAAITPVADASKDCGYTTTAIVTSSCASWDSWDASKTGKPSCVTSTSISTVYPSTCTGTWANIPADASKTGTWATVALPTGAGNATWSPVATWKGAASSTRSSSVFVVLAGAVAGAAFFL